jgi:1-pyrroline-5-carboxylate dehydrogenase
MPFENELTFHNFQQRGAEEKFHQNFEDAVEAVKAELPETHHLLIGGEQVEADETFTVHSPADEDLEVGTFPSATSEDVEQAIQAAKDAQHDWEYTPYDERAEIFEAAAESMRERKFELAATMTLENGKNRIEAMADVDEAIDFLDFYSAELRRHKGYVYDTGKVPEGQHCTNMLRPYGVFGVIAPFNFPGAIFTGMSAGALITGNAGVLKPASNTPLIAHKVFETFQQAGLPEGVGNLVTGGGSDVGQPLVEHEDVDGLVFTGSREVGTRAEETFMELGKRGPVIAELGGKNSVIVTEKADLDKAVSGITKGAFSFSGQKCSATSRVYAHESVIEELTERVVKQTDELVVGPPEDEDTFVSPVIDEAAVERYASIVEKAREDGEVLTGGERLTEGELGKGRYVAPTVVRDIPHEHELATDEHFLPFVTMHPISSLDEGIEKANDSDYALCAGLFSEDEDEIEEWFDRIESGMTYVNRHQSATTGALVQAQPFGGWKYSGTTGKFAGGYWYLPQFMREQSRTVVKTGDEE